MCALLGLLQLCFQIYKLLDAWLILNFKLAEKGGFHVIKNNLIFRLEKSEWRISYQFQYTVTECLL